MTLLCNVKTKTTQTRSHLKIKYRPNLDCISGRILYTLLKNLPCYTWHMWGCNWGFHFGSIGSKNFLKSHSWQKCLTPLILRRPPRLFTSPLFSIFPCHYLHFLLSCFFGWLCHHTTSNRFCLMILRLKVVESWYQQHLDKCFMQQAVKFTEGLAHMTWVLLVFWFDITRTQTNTQRIQKHQQTKTNLNIY